jgi:hypothetical protein
MGLGGAKVARRDVSRTGTPPMPDPTIIASPLSGPFTEGGVTVDVQIYRLRHTKWFLEVIDSSGTSTARDDLFDTDVSTKAGFHRAVAEDGIGGI